MSTALHLTPEEETAQAIINHVLEAYQTLTTAKDLSPNNPDINKTLSAYVKMTLQEPGDAVLARVFNDAAIKSIRPEILSLLSQTESAMENYFAEKFASRGSVSREDLNEFWYLRNYEELVRQDLDTVAKLIGKAEMPADWTPLFVGSGPLPLTAIMLHYETGCAVRCVDYDTQAVGASRRLIKALGLESKIIVEEGSATNFADYEQHPLVFVAALISDKDATLEHISRTAPNALVATRSVEGLRRLLYKELDVQRILDMGYEQKSFAKSSPITVNSTYMFQLPAAK